MLPADLGGRAIVAAWTTFEALALRGLWHLLVAITARMVLAVGAILPGRTLRAVLAFGAFLSLGPILSVLSVLPFGAILAIAALLTLEPLLTLPVVALPVAPLPLVALTVLSLTILALGPRFHRLFACADRFALVGEVVVAVIVELVALAALRLVVEPAALIGDHAEIMIGELEIGLGRDPVALALRVGREVLVFLEQLRRIAAGAIVDAVAVVRTALALATATLAPTIVVAATAATAAGLPIVDQAVGSLPNISRLN